MYEDLKFWFAHELVEFGAGIAILAAVLLFAAVVAYFSRDRKK